MDRKELIEAMARAVLANLADNDDVYLGGGEIPDTIIVEGCIDFIVIAAAAITAIEAQGLAIVPVEARSNDVPTAVVWTDKPEPAWVYNTTVKALRL